jgi:hypothetical protein
MKKKLIHNNIKNYVVLVFFIFVPMILLINYPLNGELLVDSIDGLLLFNNYTFPVNRLYSGELPVWNKYISNGLPSTAHGGGTLINFPAFLLGWLPRQWFVFFMYCLHISCAAFFMYLYLQEIKCDRKAAFIVALMMLFSVQLGGFRKTHMALICAIALFPSVMFFIQKHLNTGKLKYLALSSGILAFAFTYTSSQHVAYMAVTSGIYLIVITIKNRIKLSALIKNVILYALLFFTFSAIVLIPMIELFIEYKKYGTEKVSYDYFTVGSITPISLLNMLFPRFFSYSFNSNGHIPRSEMDIEFYISITAFVVILYTIKIFIRKNFYIILSLFICSIVLVYMSIGFIPGLRNIAYHIPLINSFRYPSRMLFVFLFFLYVIIALGLTKLRETDATAFLFKFQRKFTFFMLIFISIVLFILIAVFTILGGPELGKHIKDVLNFSKIAFMPIIIVLVCIACVFGCMDVISYKFRTFLYEKRRYNITIVIICLFVLTETIPFFMMTSPSIFSSIEQNELNNLLKNNIGNGKIFDAFAGIDGSHKSFISQNQSIINNFPSINSSTPFNNPMLYRFLSNERRTPFNHGGLLTGSLNAFENVMFQNDLLSMMGVKYIIDSSQILPDEGSSLPRIPLIQEQSIQLSLWSDNIQGYSYAISIKPNTFYLAVLDYDTNIRNEEMFIDLYDTVSDSLVRETLMRGKHNIEVILYSGNADKFKGEQYFRIFSVVGDIDEKIEIIELSLYEAENEKTVDMIYIPFYNDVNNRIFENINACDILFFVNEVKNIKSIDTLFTNKYNLKLDKISYIVGTEDELFDIYESTITNIDFKNNSITCVVNSATGNFLNFSQCYFPGWRVYIDGKRVELKQVNALIMGVYVPAGIHSIKFSFVSMSFIFGAIITCLGIIICIVILGIIPYYKKNLEFTSFKKLLYHKKEINKNTANIAIFGVLPPEKSGIAIYNAKTFGINDDFHIFSKFMPLSNYKAAKDSIGSKYNDNFFPIELSSTAQTMFNYNKKIFVLGNSFHNCPYLEAAINEHDKKNSFLYCHEIALHNVLLAYINFINYKKEIYSAYPELTQELTKYDEDKNKFLEKIKNLCYGIRAVLLLTGISNIIVNNSVAKEKLLNEIKGTVLENKIKVTALFLPIPLIQMNKISNHFLPNNDGKMIGVFGLADNKYKSTETIINAIIILNEKYDIKAKCVLAGYDVIHYIRTVSEEQKKYLIWFSDITEEEILSLMNQIDVAVQLRDYPHGESSAAICQLLSLNKDIITSENFIDINLEKYCTVVKRFISPDELANELNNFFIRKTDKKDTAQLIEGLSFDKFANAIINL